jgi:hypothetical protein
MLSVNLKIKKQIRIRLISHFITSTPPPPPSAGRSLFEPANLIDEGAGHPLHPDEMKRIRVRISFS